MDNENKSFYFGKWDVGLCLFANVWSSARYRSLGKLLLFYNSIVVCNNTVIATMSSLFSLFHSIFKICYFVVVQF